MSDKCDYQSVPHVCLDFDAAKMNHQLKSEEIQLFALVDGKTKIADLSMLSNIPLAEVSEHFQSLEEKGMIEFRTSPDTLPLKRTTQAPGRIRKSRARKPSVKEEKYEGLQNIQVRGEKGQKRYSLQHSLKALARAESRKKTAKMPIIRRDEGHIQQNDESKREIPAESSLEPKEQKEAAKSPEQTVLLQEHSDVSSDGDQVIEHFPSKNPAPSAPTRKTSDKDTDKHPIISFDDLQNSHQWKRKKSMRFGSRSPSPPAVIPIDRGPLIPTVARQKLEPLLHKRKKLQGHKSKDIIYLQSKGFSQKKPQSFNKNLSVDDDLSASSELFPEYVESSKDTSIVTEGGSSRESGETSSRLLFLSDHRREPPQTYPSSPPHIERHRAYSGPVGFSQNENLSASSELFPAVSGASEVLSFKSEEDKLLFFPGKENNGESKRKAKDVLHPQPSELKQVVERVAKLEELLAPPTQAELDAVTPEFGAELERDSEDFPSAVSSDDVLVLKKSLSFEAEEERPEQVHYAARRSLEELMDETQRIMEDMRKDSE